MTTFIAQVSFIILHVYHITYLGFEKGIFMLGVVLAVRGLIWGMRGVAGFF